MEIISNVNMLFIILLLNLTVFADCENKQKVFYYNLNCLEENKARIKENDEKLLPAYKNLITEADISLKSGPVKLPFFGPLRSREFSII